MNGQLECALGGNVVAMIRKRILSEYHGEEYHVDDISNADDDGGADYGLTIIYHMNVHLNIISSRCTILYSSYFFMTCL